MSTWHEEILETLKKGNGVYALLYTTGDNGYFKVWAVKSDSDEQSFYYVMDFVARRVCTCRGFRFHDSCKHTERVPEV